MATVLLPLISEKLKELIRALSERLDISVGVTRKQPRITVCTLSPFGARTWVLAFENGGATAVWLTWLITELTHVTAAIMLRVIFFIFFGLRFRINLDKKNCHDKCGNRYKKRPQKGPF